MKFSEITARYRHSLGLTLQGFGHALAQDLPGVTISKQSIQNWESGRQPPAYYFLIVVFLTYSGNFRDWRALWALDCLNALRPNLWPTVENQRPSLLEQHQEG